MGAERMSMAFVSLQGLRKGVTIKRGVRTRAVSKKGGKSAVKKEDWGNGDKAQGAKEGALRAVMADIDSSFGKGSIMRLGSDESAQAVGVETFSSGAMTL